MTVRAATISAMGPAGAGQSRQRRLRQAAERFEGILVARLMHDMQATRFGPDGLGGPGGSVYRGMLDNQFADKIASRDPFGIARLLVQQLGGAHPASSAPQPAVKAPPSVAPSSAAAVVPAAGELQRARAFAGRVMPLLVPAAKRLGTTPRSLLAQAALETGWGQHVPRTAAGADSHNLFGVKSGPHWQGAAASATTREYRDGAWHKTGAAFRAYPDLRAAVHDFVRVARGLVTGLDNGGVISARHWGDLLQRSGYATDPGYGHKLAAVAHGPLMDAVLRGLGTFFKSGADVTLNAAGAVGSVADAPR